MPTQGRQFVNRADGMPQPMTPGMFAPRTPTPTPTATPKPTPTPAKPKKLYIGNGNLNGFTPTGSGNSAMIGGFLGGGSGNFGVL